MCSNYTLISDSSSVTLNPFSFKYALIRSSIDLLIISKILEKECQVIRQYTQQLPQPFRQACMHGISE